MNKLLKQIIAYELKYFAQLTVSRFRPYVIGITGSSGKTTMKHIVGEILNRADKKVFYSTGNLNTEIGLPLSIMGYDRSPRNSIEWFCMVIGLPFNYLFKMKYPECLILEYACDKPGDMNNLTDIVEPDISIITNFGVAHMQQFKSFEKIVYEKWLLARKTKQSVICNKDVAELGEKIDKIAATIITPGDLIRSSNVEFLSNRTEFDLIKDGKSYHVNTKLMGKHNVENIVLAASACLSIGVGLEEIVSAVEKIKPLKGRGERFESRQGMLVIDESYNANPLSMQAALKNLENIDLGRKVAVLGEMMEIGKISKSSHKEIANYAKKVSDYTIGVGEGFRNEKLDNWYPNVEQLIKDSNILFRKGDIILIKGSLYNKLSKLVEYLR